MKTQTEFSQKVLALIHAIPQGKVATYGLIAELAGKPRGARGVGWLLHACTRQHQLPWHRVIRSNGQLAFPISSPAYFLQKELLENEGILIIKGRIDLRQYLWNLPI